MPILILYAFRVRAEAKAARRNLPQHQHLHSLPRLSKEGGAIARPRARTRTAKTRTAKTRTAKTRTAKTRMVRTRMARTRMVRTRMARTRMARSRMARSRMARTRMARTRMARTRMARSRMARTRMARTRMARTRMARTRMARSRMARTRAARTRMARTRAARTRMAKTRAARTRMARTRMARTRAARVSHMAEVSRAITIITTAASQFPVEANSLRAAISTLTTAAAASSHRTEANNLRTAIATTTTRITITAAEAKVTPITRAFQAFQTFLRHHHLRHHHLRHHHLRHHHLRHHHHHNIQALTTHPLAQVSILSWGIPLVLFQTVHFPAIPSHPLLPGVVSHLSRAATLHPLTRIHLSRSWGVPRPPCNPHQERSPANLCRCRTSMIFRRVHPVHPLHPQQSMNSQLMGDMRRASQCH